MELALHQVNVLPKEELPVAIVRQGKSKKNLQLANECVMIFRLTNRDDCFAVNIDHLKQLY